MTKIHNRCVTVTHLEYKSNSNHTGAIPTTPCKRILRKVSKYMEILAILTALVVSVFLSFVILELIIILITNRKIREIKKSLSRLSTRISECNSILESINEDSKSSLHP